jgi:hypothetical protein
MGELTELFPILGGGALGLAVLRIAQPKLRGLVFAIGAIAIAALAGLISGELAQSAGFLLVDLPLTVAAAALVVTVGSRSAAASRLLGRSSGRA